MILAADVEDIIRHAVTGLRGHCYSWADIGLRLGVTRQAAQQRWGGGLSGSLQISGIVALAL